MPARHGVGDGGGGGVSRLGIGRSWTETLCGPSKTTAFMVVGDVDMVLLVVERGSFSMS